MVKIMEKQLCINCTFYSAYYKKWSACFGELNHGFCAKHQKPQKQYETCQEYKSNDQKEKTRHQRLLLSLEQSLTSINEIAQILKQKDFKA